MHYANLLADLEGVIREIARYLQIEVPDAPWPTIVRNCTFAQMKADGDKLMPIAGMMWSNGSQTFFNKGTNGRWREILSEEEIALYDAVAKRELTPECRQWLENGAAI